MSAPGKPGARGCLVTATDTGVGKTIVAAAIIAALRIRGRRVAAYKPVVTGLDEPIDPDWPPDHELLAAAAAQPVQRVAPRRFGPAVSPHLAAQLAGASFDLLDLLDDARAAAGDAEVLVVEGVGGLLAPLTADHTVRDLAVELGLPLIIAARPGVGTISPTLLTIEAARLVGLTVAGVVLTPWPDQPDEVARSNRATIARLGLVEVVGLPPISRGDVQLLAAAAATLPLDRWLTAPAQSGRRSPGDAAPRHRTRRRGHSAP